MMLSRMLSWKDKGKPRITADTVRPFLAKHGLDIKDAESVAESVGRICEGLQVTETSAMFYEIVDALIAHEAIVRRSGTERKT